ncbi:RE1-silencing transcription factor [Pelobates cultripes]|uniref:RE1-silencing transcription factor n=1 Tax=Pelobates cultripes TaxID=61616 RepID=A0AAD1W5M5_PELCU|nr:RE1-silencing transcription factor [Pelobates cultripes]
MATQMVSQAGGSGLFGNNGNYGISLDGDMYGLHDLSKADMAAPRLIMLANVALTGEVNGNCCDYIMEEERQMAELTTVNDNSFSDSEGERMEESHNVDNDSSVFQIMEVEPPESQKETACDTELTVPSSPVNTDPEKDAETPAVTEDKNKCLKSKPFRCKPCQYRAENEEEFVLHIKSHSAKPFIDNESPKNTETKESDSSIPEEADFSKGPIRCDRCGYNTNRFDHYLAHLKHHNKVGENERVYKCTICTYTTVSEYHWKKHLRNHFPRIVYTCSQCSYFSDRKNNYIQHIRTHTGERPYQCIMCPYSSSQKTHLTRHMRTHSGEKPFKCEQCSYVASNQHEVTRHARQVHNGPKPLTCPHCKYKTADRSNFKKHVELHVNPRQFLCPVCDYAASKKCNLQYHIKSRHSGCSDITMDVSKVKLRTKKGEVAVLDTTAIDVQDDNEYAKENDSEVKKPEKSVKVEKKDSVKPKKQIPDPVITQVTRSSRRSVSQPKPDGNEVSTEIPSKVKCGKRKATVAPENQSKTSDAETINIKKRKLVQKNKGSQVAVVTKTLKSKKTHKMKRRMKKIKENKLSIKNEKKKAIEQGKRKKLKMKSKKTVSDKNVEKENSPKKKTQVNDTGSTLTTCTGETSVQECAEREEDVSIPTADPQDNKEVHTECKINDSVIVHVPTCNSNVALHLPTQDLNVSNELPIENDKNAASLDVVTPSSIAVEAESNFQTPSDQDSESVQVNEFSKSFNSQVTPLVEVSDSNEAPTTNCPSDTSENACSVEKSEEPQEQNKLEKDDKLEIGKENEGQDVSDKSCSLDAKELLEVQQRPEEVCSFVQEDKNLEGEDKSEHTSNVHINEVLGQEISEQTSDFQRSNDSSQEISENPCNVEICMEPIELDKPKINAESLKPEESIGTQNLLVECCTKSVNDCEPKEIKVSPCDVSSNESLDTEEDEGIHSHDGSDISDNVSERSDDSGLNGVPSVQEQPEPKSSVEPSASKSNVASENFVCIFCDRAFRKEEEYTKHLKRHLVNVYYLEKAAQGQV